MSFFALSGRESSLVQTFCCEFCVQLGITHPSVHMTRRFVIQGCPTLVWCMALDALFGVVVLAPNFDHEHFQWFSHGEGGIH